MDRKVLHSPNDFGESFGITREEQTSGWTMPFSHHHDYYEIYILESGERTVTFDEKKDYVTRAGDAALFRKGITHTSRGSTPYSGMCVYISEAYIDTYFTHSAKSRLLECFNVPVIHLNKMETKRIKAMAENFSADAPNNFIMLASLLNLMNTAAARKTPEAMPKNRYEIPLKSEQVIKYVEQNYVYINCVADIANALDVSESYVFTLFKRKFGTTPKNYVNKLRMDNAQHLLVTTGENIKSVALNSGFNSYEYFMRVFKRTYGCTPKEYRNKNKG